MIRTRLSQSKGSEAESKPFRLHHVSTSAFCLEKLALTIVDRKQSCLVRYANAKETISFVDQQRHGKHISYSGVLRLERRRTDFEGQCDVKPQCRLAGQQGPGRSSLKRLWKLKHARRRRVIRVDDGVASVKEDMPFGAQVGGDLLNTEQIERHSFQPQVLSSACALAVVHQDLNKSFNTAPTDEKGS